MEDMHKYRPTYTNLWTGPPALNFTPQQITMWASTWGSFNSGLFFTCLDQAGEDLRNLDVIECDVKVSLSVSWICSVCLHPSASSPTV